MTPLPLPTIRSRRRLTSSVLMLAAALTLASCAGTADPTDDSRGPLPVPTTSGDGDTLTVWVMQDDYDDATLTAINTEFTERTGAEVDVQVQQWDGITTRLSTALATSTPPDVVDLGNTQVASFAANGALLDLTAYQDDLAAGRTWLGGLIDPATVDGRVYAVPGFAGTRAVIYNKTVWADAGIDAAPQTYEELTAALDAVAEAHDSPDFSPLYLPGQQWQAGMQFVWDAGGDFATSEDGTWIGQLGSPEGQAGLEAWREFQNTYSAEATRTLDTETPPAYQVMADGRASAIIASSGFIARILESNPQLTEDDLGTFPLPGASGQTQPVFLGGSVWGVPARSDAADLALQWTQIAAGPEIQRDFVFGSNGWIPNTVEAIDEVSSMLTPLQSGYFAAAQRSHSTPAAANWAALEGDLSVNALFADVASGRSSVSDAAAAFDAHLEDALDD